MPKILQGDTMKKFFISFLLLFFSIPSLVIAKDVYVKGYHRKDGSYVQPYYRTTPDMTKNNNYSTLGNRNPYTGEYGTKPRDNYNNYNTQYKKYK